jgi:hypothetical protein
VEVQSTWGRDFKILTTIYALLQDEWGISTADLETATGEDKASIFDAVMLLEEGGFLRGEVFGAGAYVHIERANRTERGLREVGAWPTPDVVAEQLVQALQTIAEREADPEKKRSLGELVKQIRPKHLVDLARALQVLMDTGVLPKLG